MTYLSFVCAARNDNHGGKFLERLFKSLESFSRQSEYFKLHTEFLIVEWNPVKNKKSLQCIIEKKINKNKFCSVRVIRVPEKYHYQLDNSKNLQFFQMIAKNVGIRRAQGKFILASNIDIILSKSLFEFLAKKKLRPNLMYRSDRFDVKYISTKNILDDTNSVCKNGNLVRINKKNSHQNIIFIQSLLSLREIASKKDKLKRIWKEKMRILLKRIGIKVKSKYTQHLHACGDFTLLSKNAWNFLRGYPETPIHSWHLDSIFCIQAHNAGFYEEVLLFPLVHFHQEHQGGFTPESGDRLFKKLGKRKIPFIQDEFGAIESHIKGSKQAVVFNNENWGLGNIKLEERIF